MLPLQRKTAPRPPWILSSCSPIRSILCFYFQKVPRLPPAPIPLQYPHLGPNSSCLQGCKLSEDCALGCPSPHCHPELWAALGNGNPIRFGTYFLPFNKPLAPQLQRLTLASGDPPEAMSSFGTFLVCLGLGLGTESPGSLGSPCPFA